MIDLKTWKSGRLEICEQFYEDIVETVDCGPFDGGCVIVAQALQKVLGGEICVVTRSDGRVDHAAVLVDGRLWDWDGPASPSGFIRRFNRSEHAAAIAWRPYRTGDLPDAASDDALADRLAVLIGHVVQR